MLIDNGSNDNNNPSKPKSTGSIRSTFNSPDNASRSLRIETPSSPPSIGSSSGFGENSINNSPQRTETPAQPFLSPKKYLGPGGVKGWAGITIVAAAFYHILIGHHDHSGWLHYLSTFFIAGYGFTLILSWQKLIMSLKKVVVVNYSKKTITRIDLRTMRPSEKQKVVDHHRREYCREHHCCEYVCYAWEPADATEIWIKESHDGELFQEFVTRLLRKHALMKQRQVVWTPDDQPHNQPHPLIQALADVNTEARKIVWRLGDDVAYQGFNENEK